MSLRFPIQCLVAGAYFVAACLGVTSSTCTKDTFASWTLPGTELLSINATVAELSSLSEDPVFLATNVGPVNSSIPATQVCQVAIQYTHSGWSDTINTYIWLPASGWNGRLMSLGGGGWLAGALDQLAFPAVQGYAAVTTDGGHALQDEPPTSWAMVDGNINWIALLDFASIALEEAATLAKAAVSSFYGSPPEYSYWNGCSTGGRQGHMMAQRFPSQYDGILAVSSAINWDRMLPAEYWPQLVMQLLDYAPSQCELDAITQAAISACDPLDGVTDGIISSPGRCDFDPTTLIGRNVNCSNPSGSVKVSSQAAQIASEAWKGPTDEDGKFLWYGLGHAASLGGLANTTCTSPINCSSSPFSITADWLRIYLLRDETANLESLSLGDYSRLFRSSVDQFSSVIGTANPVLTDFKKSGGKMITWHGTADELIPYNGTMDYYKRVLEYDPEAANYYKFFTAPGIGHCFGGPGWYPGGAMDLLVAWVEEGTVPDTLLAHNVSSDSTEKGDRSVNLCAYPRELVYSGGDPNEASSFLCR